MKQFSDLLQGFTQPKNEENQKLIGALVNTQSAVNEFFEIWPLPVITDTLMTNIYTVGERLPDEGEHRSRRNEMQKDLHFFTDLLRTMLTVSESVNEVNRQEEEGVSPDGVKRYFKEMMQDTFKLMEKNQQPVR